jgi:putative ABC transport system substrate-binding protein
MVCAQQTEQARRIGVLMNVAAEHPEGQPFIAAFREALQLLGWNDGRNIRIDIRWGENDVDRDRKYAAELVALAPDVIVAAGTLSVSALQRVTPSRSCLCAFPIQLAPALSKVWPGRVAT